MSLLKVVRPAMWNWRIPGKLLVEIQEYSPPFQETLFGGRVYEWGSSVAVYLCSGPSMDDVASQLEKYLTEQTPFGKLLPSRDSRTVWERL